MQSIDRRFLLKASFAGAAVLSLPPLAGRAFAAAPSASAVAGNVTLISGAGANVLALKSSDGTVLVDSGAAGQTEALMAVLSQVTQKRPVTTLFNTHRHLENTGGNAAFRKAGAEIIAHKKAHQWMANAFWNPEEYRYEPARAADELPTRTFRTTGSMTAGGERIDYGYLLEAHTEGDIYVHFRDADVIAVGGVVSPVRDPGVDWFTGAWIGARLDMQEKIIAMAGPNTRIVPSFGPVLTRNDVQAEHDMLLAIHTKMVELLRKGMGAEDMLKEGVMENTGRTWADPLHFLYAGCKGLWGHNDALSPDIV